MEIKNLSLTYNASTINEVNVFNNINFDVYRNETLAIIGPSGCGKSSLIRIISGLVEKTSGSIILNGKDDFKNSFFGYVDQGSILMPNLNVFNNILLPFKIRKIKFNKCNIENILDIIGLKEATNMYPYQLSGGMKQRVAIARELVLHPEVLLLDEPFSDLDEMIREKLQKELFQIKKTINQTILIVTHNIEEAVFLADRIIIMSNKPSYLKSIINVKLMRSDKKEEYDIIKNVRKILYE